jgi:SagB-type dehydrogenase family enzyme
MAKITNYLFEESISKEGYDFLESSKMNSYEALEYSKRLLEVMNNSYFMQHICEQTNELGWLEEISLPVNEYSNDLCQNLDTLNHLRTSSRQFSGEQISLSDLSQLLNLSYKKTRKGIKENFIPDSRNIASGGGLYPVDLYFVSLNINNLPRGVYHYNLDRNSLEKLPLFETDEIFQNAVNQAFLTEAKVDIDYAKAAGYIILGSVLHRTCFKYLDRGIRWALIDTGAIIHSVYLASASIGIGCCSVGGYCDDFAAELIGFTDKSQIVFGTIIIGKV